MSYEARPVCIFYDTDRKSYGLYQSGEHPKPVVFTGRTLDSVMGGIKEWHWLFRSNEISFALPKIWDKQDFKAIEDDQKEPIVKRLGKLGYAIVEQN